MRLLYLNPIGHVGGAERVLLAAIAGAKRELPSAAIRLIALGDGPLSAPHGNGAVEVVPLPTALGELGDSRLPGGRTALALRSLRGVPALAPFIRSLSGAVRSFAPDLVHSNGIKTHLLGRLAVSAAVPVVWHLHDFYSSRPAARWLLRRARSRGRAAIAVSRAVEVDARAVLPGVRIDVVPNAVDLARFTHPAPATAPISIAAAAYLRSEGTVRVGLVATYARWKGQLLVLDTAAKLAARSPQRPSVVLDRRTDLSRRPVHRGRTERKSRARGLSHRVGFVPFLHDPARPTAAEYRPHASTRPGRSASPSSRRWLAGARVVSQRRAARPKTLHGRNRRGGHPAGNVEQLAATVESSLMIRASALDSARGPATTIEQLDANRYGTETCRIYQSITPLT